MLLSFRKKPGGYLDAVIVVVGWGTSIYSATSIFAFDVPSVDISLPSFSPFLSLSLSLSRFLFNRFDAGDALGAPSEIHSICITAMKVQFQRLKSLFFFVLFVCLFCFGECISMCPCIYVLIHMCCERHAVST